MIKRIFHIPSWSLRNRMAVGLAALMAVLGTSAAVRAATAPDFALSVAPSSQSVGSGGAANYVVSVGPSGGFSGNVTLTAGNLPKGTAATWNVNGTTTSGSTVVVNVPAGSLGVSASVTIGGGQPTAGTYAPGITATGGGITHSTPLTFVVTGQNTANFSLSAAPQSQTISQGKALSETITITRSDWTGPVTLGPVTVTNSQGSIAVTNVVFSPSAPTGNSATASFTLPPNTPAGYYTVAVTGSAVLSGKTASTRSAVSTLVVQAATTTALAVPSTGIINTAVAASYFNATFAGATATGVGGTITYKVFGPQSTPPASCTSGGTLFGTAQVNANGRYTPSAGWTPPNTGSYWFYASYSGDSYNAPSASACGSGMPSMSVQDFSLTGSPPTQTALTGGSSDDAATYTVSVTPVNGFAGTVSLGASSPLPSGITVSSTNSSSVTFDIASNTVPATYPLTLQGQTTVNGATVTRTTAVSLVVNPSSPFQISGSVPSPLYPGAKAQTFTVTLSNPNSFPIHVLSDSVTVQPQNAPGCAPAWFSVTLPGITGTGISIAANSSASVQASAQMLDVNAPQDACQGKTLTLAYSGTYGK